MSASPTAAAAQPSQTQKRPLEEPSSPSGAGDQPEAKRPALDKVIKNDAPADLSLPANPVTGHASEIIKSEPEDSSNRNGSSPAATQAGASQDLKAVPSAIPSNVSSTTPADESQWLHIRSIISSAEAATVIGKGGENVTLIRRMSGAKCTVSDYARGAVERVLTVSGPVDAVAKVFPSFFMFKQGTDGIGFWFNHSHTEQ
jgi:heterogeneous nuclear rnp K-like protein 2